VIARRVAAFGLLAVLSAGGAEGAGPTDWAVAVLPSGHEYSLEIAADAASRERGYMGRERVGPREGMLFIFDADAPHAFWMKNCKVALDMVWLDRSRRVVWVAADQKPCPEAGECPTIAPPAPARYVLELAAGTAAREKLRAGDDVVILGEPRAR
jgi:uncharacterized membrane protein (UPF0127 family)